jgi:hypothetical protein
MTRDRREGGQVYRTELAVPDGLASLKPVRDVLAEAIAFWNTPVECDPLLLLVTEVLTNAVDHGTPPISVSMDWDGTRVHVEVTDSNDAEPVLRDPAPEDDDGRGIWLVARMANTWGVRHGPRGKAVWFELSAAGPAPLGDADRPTCEAHP